MKALFNSPARRIGSLLTVLMVSLLAANAYQALHRNVMPHESNPSAAARALAQAIDEPTHDSGAYLAAFVASRHKDLEAMALYESILANQKGYDMDKVRQAFYVTLHADSVDASFIFAERILASHQASPTLKAEAYALLAARALRKNDIPLARQHAQDALALTDKGLSTDSMMARLSQVILDWLALPHKKQVLATWATASGMDAPFFQLQGALAQRLFPQPYHNPNEAILALYQRVIDAPNPSPYGFLLYGDFLWRIGQAQNTRALYRTLQSRGEPFTTLARPLLQDSLANQPYDEAKQPLVIRDAKQAIAFAFFWQAYRLDSGAEAQAHPLSYSAEKLNLLQMALIIDPLLAPALWLKADILQRLNHRPQAQTTLATLEENPLWRQSARGKRLSLFLAENKLDSATALLEATIAQDPNNTRAQRQLADLLVQQQRFADALIPYSHLIDTDPQSQNDWHIFYARGVAFTEEKQFQQGEQDLLKAIELNPNAARAMNFLAYSWAERNTKLPQALDLLKRALTLRPNDGFILDSYGWVLYKLGHYEKALDAISKAIAINPDEPDIRDHLGDVLWKLGRKNDARFHWQKTIHLITDEQKIQDLKNKLNAL
ncbi:MAG: tetratricopeptide repeat protein [Alphaproteobacteria bacterium GM202ARS2]|nr:tetratricopeptide repeat protein [Alphaproteobacteria bacterium GM202ARS2]